MQKTVFQVAAAVAAAAIVLLVVAVSGSLSGVLRWLLVAATALVSFAAAWFSARRVSRSTVSGVEIGNRIKSGEDVHIQGLNVQPNEGSTHIGNDIRSKRSTRLLDIVIGKSRRSNK